MRILGIELGSWSVKAVEVESRFRRLEVLDFHEIPLPLEIVDPQAVYREAVGRLLARLPHHPEKVVTSLPASQTALRFFHVPIKQAKKVEQMYQFELEDAVPFKLATSNVEHHLSRTKDGHLVAAAVAPKRHIQAHIEWLQAVGIDPDWLTFEGMGLVNLYLLDRESPGAGEPDGCEMLLDIGHLKTGIAVLREGRLEYYRSLSWGGAHVTHAIATELGLSLEEAEKKKTQELSLEVAPDRLSGAPQQLVSAAWQAFTPFLSDLQHTIVAYRALQKKEVEGLLLAGGTAAVPGLETFLREGLGKPARVFNPLLQKAGAAELSPRSALRFGEAYGRATVYERKASLLFNFRKHDLAKKTSLTEVSTVLKNPAVRQLLKYAGVLAAMLFVHVTIAGHLAESEAKRAKEELRKALALTFSNLPKKMTQTLTSDPNELKKFIAQRNKELDQKIKMLSRRRTPVLSLVKAVSQAFPVDVKVDVNNLSLDDRSLLIEGVLYQGDLAKVTENLKQIPSVENLNLTRDGQRFTYTAQMTGR